MMVKIENHSRIMEQKFVFKTNNYLYKNRDNSNQIVYDIG